MRYLFFSAPWCGPCKNIKPKVIESGKSVTFVDIEDEREIADKYGIRSIPTLLRLDGDSVSLECKGQESILKYLNLS